MVRDNLGRGQNDSLSTRVPINFDPEPAEDFWAGSELERMVVGCEVATDEFVTAIDRHSVAEAAYLRAYHTAWQRLVDVSKSKADADRSAEHAAVEEKINEKRAAGMMESAKAVLRTRLAVLSAAQSHMRAVERQT